jgi:hypothetical protein
MAVDIIHAFMANLFSELAASGQDMPRLKDGQRRIALCATPVYRLAAAWGMICAPAKGETA